MSAALAASEGWTLLTGGNRGLGLGLAKKLVVDGRKVLLASRTLPAAKRAADAIAAATPQHPDCVRCGCWKRSSPTHCNDGIDESLKLIAGIEVCA